MQTQASLQIHAKDVLNPFSAFVKARMCVNIFVIENISRLLDFPQTRSVGNGGIRPYQSHILMAKKAGNSKFLFLLTLCHESENNA